MKISVIICTYNPCQKFFVRVLDALRNQSMGKNDWELIIVDNNSNVRVDSFIDLRDFPNCKFVVEKNQGLTNARIRGITESNSQLLCFVDDDNVLSDIYLETGLRIARSKPFLGAFSGNSIPEYEGNSLPHCRLDLRYLLALRSVDRDWWSNSYHSGCKPIGAGMFVKKVIADYYLQILKNCNIRADLDRKGDSLFSGGDSDLAMVSIDLGLGYGLFSDLYLVHLIPESRVQKNYLVKLARNMQLSSIILNYVRFDILPSNRLFSLKDIIICIYLYVRYTSFERAILNSERWAIKKFHSTYYKSIQIGR